MVIAKETITAIISQSAILPLLLSQISDSSILQISFSLDTFGNVDDDCGNADLELEEVIAIVLFVNASTRFS